MSTHIDNLKKNIEPLRQAIINHKVYSVIKHIDDLKIFMEHHVYAVWDFMSLLKALQNNLTCTEVPWFPKGDAETRYLINEIVTGEESDIDAAGIRKSHFELYLEAMEQCGANNAGIASFTDQLLSTKNIEQAFVAAQTPSSAASFVRFTFEVINRGQAHLQAAIFTFGREDLIPNMFHAIINDIYQKFPENISTFKYYLDRHIEVDGDHHSHLALAMTNKLCGNDEAYWAAAEEACIQSLQKRMALWDGVYEKISMKYPCFKHFDSFSNNITKNRPYMFH